MAGSGIKANVQLTAGNIATGTLLYTVPAGYYGIYNVSFTNTANASVNIRMYIGTSTAGSQQAAEAYEYQTAVIAYGVFERTGIVIDAGKNIVVMSSGTAVNVSIYGIETSTS
jgi:hypothetical protein